jgi:hypothetical protein
MTTSSGQGRLERIGTPAEERRPNRKTVDLVVEQGLWSLCRNLELPKKAERVSS